MEVTETSGNTGETNIIILFFRVIHAMILHLSEPLFEAFYILFMIAAPYLIWSGIIAILILFIMAIIRLICIFKETRNYSVFLELTPSQNTNESQFATEQLFKTIHTITEPTSWIETFVGHKRPISFEIVSTKKDGIRFIIKTSEYNAHLVEKNIRSFLPFMEVREIVDYLPNSKSDITGFWNSIEIKLSKHFAVPLTTQTQLGVYDPIAYITGAMTQLSKDDLIAFQLVLTPVYSDTHPKASSELSDIRYALRRGADISPYLNRSANLLKQTIQLPFKFIPQLFLFVLLTPLQLISWLLSNDKRVEMLPFHVFDLLGGSNRSEDFLSKNELEFNEMVSSKVHEDLYEASLRVIVKGDFSDEVSERMRGIISAFAPFDNSYQWIRVKRNGILDLLYNIPFMKKILFSSKYFFLKHRFLSLFNNPIFSVSEVSSLYHFPYTATTKTEDIVKNKTRKLPTPLALKNETNFDSIFAKNDYGNKITPIGLTLEERRRHMYVIGATGTGKTTLIQKMIYQDIKNHKGLAVLDPHGDLSEKLISIIPKSRLQDVVYFNPYDMNFPIGLNVLELPKDLKESELHREKDLIVSSLISIFHKLYPERYSGPRMEHVLRNTVLTALETENPTLVTVYKLLTNTKYRKSVQVKLTDPMLKDFWQNEFSKFGSYQQADLISPITNKLGRFLTTKMTRNILMQERSKINFEEIMNEGKILICDLSKGKIGEDTSSFLGSLIIAKIQLAALKRVHLPQEARNDFFLYIDEFQNFATMTFAQILSEARKYKLNSILAHQTVSQIEDKDLLKVILANTGTIISFRTNNPTDESTILPLFSPQVEKNEIPNLPSYHFYIKINALKPLDTFTGTFDDFDIPVNMKIREKVIEFSQKTYGRKVEDLAQPELAKETSKPKKAVNKFEQKSHS